MKERHESPSFEGDAREHLWREVARRLDVARIDDADREELLRQESDVYPHARLIDCDPDGLNEGADFERLVSDIAERLKLMGVGPVVVPDSWARRSRKTLMSHVELQHRALVAFNLEELLPLTDLPELIALHADLQRPAGDKRILEYPNETNDRPSKLAVHRGVSDESELRLPEHGLAVKARLVPSLDQPLYRLAQLAERMSTRTGFEPWQCVGYLLCDELDYTLPYIEVRARIRGDRTIVEIDVPSIEIPAQDVANEYRRALSQIGPFGIRKMGPAERREALQAFIEAHPEVRTERGGHRITELRRLWNDQSHLHAGDLFTTTQQLSQFIDKAKSRGHWQL